MPVLMRPAVRPIELSERGEVEVVDVCGVLAEYLAAERAVDVLERRDCAAERFGEQAGGVREVGFEHAVIHAEPLRNAVPTFKNVDESFRRKVFSENAAHVYNIDLATL